MTSFGTPVPILRSFDEARAKEFYLDLLGFELVFEHRFAAGMPLYMGVRAGDCVLHLTEHWGDGSPGAALRLPVDDVDVFAATLRARNHPHVRPGEPEIMPWGSRDLTLTDPAGNRLTFFTASDHGQA